MMVETPLRNHDKVIVVGSSMGAWIALHLARLHPRRIVGVIGIASAPDYFVDLFHAQSKEVQDEWKQTGV